MHCSKAILILSVALACQGAEFSGERALESTAQVVAFGARIPGSAAHKRAEEWIKKGLGTAGCEVTDDRFTASTPSGQVEMNNIICRFPGSTGKAVVFSGHYDTKVMPAIPFVGANDGGSSTGALIELARAVSGTKRTHDVYIVFFDGEEAYVSYTDADGFYGSRHLAEQWANEGLLDDIIALINIDMIGDQDLGIVREWGSDSFLVDMIWDVAEDLGYGKYFLRSRGSVLDDHVAFLDRGVPAVDLIDFDYGPENSYWHTPRDTMNKLSAESLEAVGRVLVETLRRLDQLGK